MAQTIFHHRSCLAQGFGEDSTGVMKRDGLLEDARAHGPMEEAWSNGSYEERRPLSTVPITEHSTAENTVSTARERSSLAEYEKRNI